ncbi:MAG: sugar phosphate nucleotidyltransferase [Coriobacteriia bacterium]|nr:sugar phosphate nucleotidyltransferase [Coriobacteriia bacterium]
MKAIIPAAGLGTRFLPATKAVPKELLPVLEKPAIQYVVEEALAAAADEIIIISSATKHALEAHFNCDLGLEALLAATGKTAYAEAVHHAGNLPVSFIEQAQPLGLGHAIHCAAEKVCAAVAPEPFYVLLGDVLVPENSILPRMLAISQEHDNASVIAVFEVPMEEVSRFGVIAGEAIKQDIWRISEMVEKPPQDRAPSNLAIFGRYLLSPRVMELLAHTVPGVGGEIQLTDALVSLLAEEEMYALVIDPEEGFDVGTVESWLITNIKLARRRGILGELL